MPTSEGVGGIWFGVARHHYLMGAEVKYQFGRLRHAQCIYFVKTFGNTFLKTFVETFAKLFRKDLLRKDTFPTEQRAEWQQRSGCRAPLRFVERLA